MKLLNIMLNIVDFVIEICYFHMKMNGHVLVVDMM